MDATVNQSGYFVPGTGGQSGIRTHDTVARIVIFKSVVKLTHGFF